MSDFWSTPVTFWRLFLFTAPAAFFSGMMTECVPSPRERRTDARLSALEAAAGHCDCAPATTPTPDGGP